MALPGAKGSPWFTAAGQGGQGPQFCLELAEPHPVAGCSCAIFAGFPAARIGAAGISRTAAAIVGGKRVGLRGPTSFWSYFMRRRFPRRSGFATVQWIVVAALVVLVVFASVRLIGTGSSTKMTQTATDLTNPTNLTKHMGS
jgi:hypothetical protein